jgi:hypothetical membrane protein
MNDKLKKILGIENGPILGIVATAILLAGLIIPQFAFTGPNPTNERYSMLDHFISELGWQGISEWAIVFNVCLIVGALMFVPFALYTKKQMNNKYWRVGSICGVISAIACSFIGVFPMNLLTIIPHTIVAMTFFLGSVVMLMLFSIALLLEKNPLIPKYFAIGGILLLIFFICMFSGVGVDFSNISDIGNPLDLETFFLTHTRDELGLMPLFEWLMVLTVLITLFLIAIFLYRKRKIVKIN